MPKEDLVLIHAGLKIAEITERIKAKGRTQQQAAEVTGMPQPKLSQMLRGQFYGISEAKLMESLTRQGHPVQIAVEKPTRKKSAGPIEVRWFFS
ncbi:MAG: helix-turn-helix domain-containing protein [Betaproteobacteria bacterium]|nr:helix-turn-helix domain-containing protein [Betaproteobacteria bacterium]